MLSHSVFISDLTICGHFLIASIMYRVHTHSLGPQTPISYRGGPGWNVGFVVDKVALGYTFIGVLRFSPVITITSLLSPALCNSATDSLHDARVYVTELLRLN